jgi:hypothetical protein
MGATGTVVAALPAGPAREEILGLVRLGLAFRARHGGRRPGPLRRHVEATVARLPERTFEALLLELELDAVRHQVRGETPILRVDRVEEVLRYLDGEREVEVTFGHLRNLARLRDSRVPQSSESDPYRTR